MFFFYTVYDSFSKPKKGSHVSGKLYCAIVVRF